jgi:hypothetical protein
MIGRRLGELLAVEMIGEGVAGFLAPDRYTRMWRIGAGAVPALAREHGGTADVLKVARWFRRQNSERLLALPVRDERNTANSGSCASTLQPALIMYPIGRSTASARPPPIGPPHSGQNFAPAGTTVVHEGQD